MAPSILWFRRDLRLSDHPALHEAVRLGGADGVVPLFVLDETFLAPAGPTRASFLRSSLEALEASMGSPLCVLAGDPVTAVTELAEGLGVAHVVVSGDFGPSGSARDDAVAEALGHHGIALHRVSSPYCVDPGTVRGASGGPVKVFTAFRRRWEVIGPHVVLPVPDVSWVNVPSLAALDEIPKRAGTRRPALFADLPDAPPTALPPAGESEAMSLLERFCEGPIDRYDHDRNVFATPGTSHLSPHLRFGSLHPRTALAAAAGADKGATTFRSEIAWREFYADVLHHHPDSVTEPLQPKMARLRVDTGPAAQERFCRWARGETGIPLVDASMRQLLAEGWMHNRGRMLTASFLVKHLHLDWRWGARWFMWRLIDGDLASNTHGWQWTAGTGTDASPFYRIFSPLAQAERFDPDAQFVHAQIPELSEIPAPRVLQPGGGVDLLSSADYPAAMIDLGAERIEALRRLDETKAE